MRRFRTGSTQPNRDFEGLSANRTNRPRVIFHEYILALRDTIHCPFSPPWQPSTPLTIITTVIMTMMKSYHCMNKNSPMRNTSRNSKPVNLHWFIEANSVLQRLMYGRQCIASPERLRINQENLSGLSW